MNKRLNLMFDGSGGKTIRRTANWLLLLTALMIAVLLGGGMQQDDVVIPKEGEVVTWKQNPQLIIKAKLGQRREHIPSTCVPCEADFYRPQYEHYVGQFPIDYVPKKFAPLSKEEAKKVPMPYSDHQLEFSLMLNGVKGKATDAFNNDDENKVKVEVQGLTMAMRADNTTTKSSFEHMVTLPGRNALIPETLFHKHGLTCYYSDVKGTHFRCFGNSSGESVTGVYLLIPTEKAGYTDIDYGRLIKASYYEPILGGVWITWQTNYKNWDKWREIDAAVWRLLNAWNVSPNPETPIYVDKYKQGDLVAWQLTPQLIIKTTLGQRKVKSYKSFESSRFLGQFAIDYQTKKENLLDNKIPIEDISKIETGLSFNLLLNQQKDAPIYEFNSNSMVVDQVGVSIRNDEGANLRNPTEWIKYLHSLGNLIITGEKFDHLGMECYPKHYGDLICIGKSSNVELSEFLIDVDKGVNASTGWISGMVSTRKYGSQVIANWKAKDANLKDWREIDAAIWRFLDAWNVASQSNKTH
jgi:hypothetical protein